MTDPSATPPPGKALSASERMALLHSLAFTALRLSVAQLDAFTSRLAGALARQSEQVDDAELCRHAFQHLNQYRASFHRLVGDRLQQALLQAVEATAEQGTSRLDSGAMDLSLITFDAMQRKVTIDNLSQTLDAANTQELTALGLRIAHWLQSDGIGSAQNPFRSAVFVKAVSEAWAKFDPNGASHHMVLRQLRPEVFLQLSPIWQALNQELVVRKVLPDVEAACRRMRSDSLPAPSMQHKLQNWLAPEGALNIANGRSLELLKKMLTHMLRDEVIPAAIRDLLSRMQAPLTLAVMADNDFFFNEKHPARHLLEVIVKSGLACKPEKDGADPLYQIIARIVDWSQQPDPSGNVLDDLESFIAQEEQKFHREIEESITEATTQENLSRAQKMAEDEVTSRIEAGDVTGFVEVFLQTQWTRVLAFAYGVRDSRPDVLPNMLKAMDDLIWSVRPKAGVDERKKLLERLPALLSMLNAWLNVVKWEGEERTTFFSTLAAHHAMAMRPPRELNPREQLEIRMDVAQKASEHHLSKRAREQQEEAIAEFMRQIDRLEAGTWIEFVRNNGSRANCRLAWISPGRSRLVFVGPQGPVFTLADEVLAQAMRAGRVRVIPTDTVVKRALAAALEELGTGLA